MLSRCVALFVSLTWTALQTIEDVVLTGEMGIDIKSGKGRGGYIRDVVFRRFRHTFGRTKCRSDLPCPEAPLDHENYGSQSEGWMANINIASSGAGWQAL